MTLNSVDLASNFATYSCHVVVLCFLLLFLLAAAPTSSISVPSQHTQTPAVPATQRQSRKSPGPQLTYAESGMGYRDDHPTICSRAPPPPPPPPQKKKQKQILLGGLSWGLAV